MFYSFLESESFFSSHNVLQSRPNLRSLRRNIAMISMLKSWWYNSSLKRWPKTLRVKQKIWNTSWSARRRRLPRRKRRSRKRVTSPIFPRTGTGLGDGVAEQSDKQPWTAACSQSTSLFCKSGLSTQIAAWILNFDLKEVFSLKKLILTQIFRYLIEKSTFHSLFTIFLLFQGMLILKYLKHVLHHWKRKFFHVSLVRGS